MTHGIAEANGIKIWYDRIGDEQAPCILLITGAVGQAVAWNVCFCEMLAERGYQVIRFDQRDSGLSQKFPELTYSADDVADDAVGLLDALGIPHAHIFGVSAGGAFAQIIAMRHPHRCLSLTSFMSTSVNPMTDPGIIPTAERIVKFRSGPIPEDPAARIERIVETFREYLSGPRFPVNDEFVRDYARQMMEREGRVGDSPRLAAVLRAAWPFDKARLAKIRCPTLVIHGTADPLCNYTAGLTTVRAIPGARLLPIEGMGHDLTSPRAFPLLIDAVDEHARTAPPAWVRAGLNAPSATARIPAGG